MWKNQVQDFYFDNPSSTQGIQEETGTTHAALKAICLMCQQPEEDTWCLATWRHIQEKRDPASENRHLPKPHPSVHKTSKCLLEQVNWEDEQDWWKRHGKSGRLVEDTGNNGRWKESLNCEAPGHQWCYIRGGADSKDQSIPLTHFTIDINRTSGFI